MLRWTLLILGALLVGQGVVSVVLSLVQMDGSTGGVGQTVGTAVDANLMRLTLGLVAITLSRNLPAKHKITDLKED